MCDLTADYRECLISASAYIVYRSSSLCDSMSFPTIFLSIDPTVDNDTMDQVPSLNCVGPSTVFSETLGT